MTRSRREILEALIEVMDARQFERLGEFVTDDYLEEYPQTGERIRGIANVRAIAEHYPGGLDAGRLDVGRARLVGEEEQWLAGPGFAVIHVAGSGDTYVGVVRSRYPDGSDWYLLVFAEFRGDLIAKNTYYFAPVLPAPDWRAQWVERFAPVEPSEPVDR